MKPKLLDAASSGALVTVKTVDNRALTGFVSPHPTDPERYVVRLGNVGRPPVVHQDDVKDVIFE